MSTVVVVVVSAVVVVVVVSELRSSVSQAAEFDSDDLDIDLDVRLNVDLDVSYDVEERFESGRGGFTNFPKVLPIRR